MVEVYLVDRVVEGLLRVYERSRGFQEVLSSCQRTHGSVSENFNFRAFSSLDNNLLVLLSSAASPQHSIHHVPAREPTNKLCFPGRSLYALPPHWRAPHFNTALSPTRWNRLPK